jgi:ATP-binding cassette, subfamily B, bacterial MsbA
MLNGAPPKLTLRQRVARVWPYFKQSRAAWAWAVGATVLTSATEPFVPALLKPLLDRGFQGNSFDLWVVPAALMLLFTIRGVSGFIAQFALAKVTNDGLLRLREAMFNKLLTARLSLFADQTSSAIANTVVYEVSNGSSMLINSVLKLARDVLTLFALAAYLLYLNWKLTLVVALLFPAVGLVVQTLSRRLYRLTRESQTATDGLAYVVEENVLAHRDVRLHGAQQAQAVRFDFLSRSLRRLSMKSTSAHAAMSAITQILAAISLSAVVSVAILQGNENAITVGGFVAFVTAMLLLIAPIKGLSDAATPITRGLAALERALDLLNLTPDESGGTFNLSRAKGDIDFRNVSVSYRESALPAVNGVSLSIRAGETVALVGASGSGKTTLVSLLPRFVESTGGTILLDGHDLKTWNLSSLREQIAIVSQHVLMLNGSIGENVALGQPLDRARVRECLNAAHLSAFVESLPEGIDAMLGHNATQLSGGQRQRLAIARALYKDAPILILDEATSALDAESEQAVQQAIKALTRGRTSLIIAHRLSTIAHADRVLVLDNGKLAESGTHRDLLLSGGLYAKLQALQQNGT